MIDSGNEQLFYCTTPILLISIVRGSICIFGFFGAKFVQQNLFVNSQRIIAKIAKPRELPEVDLNINHFTQSLNPQASISNFVQDSG
jgi:hypothetical protein